MTILEQLQTGVAHHRAGRFADAAVIYRQVLLQAPFHCDALHLLGLVEDHHGRREQAAQLIEAAIRSDPRQIVFYLSLAQVCEALGRFQDAYRNFQIAAKLDPSSVAALIGSANCLAKLGRHSEAKDCFLSVIPRCPDAPALWFNLGNTHYALQDYLAAQQCYHRALELSPGHSDAINNLALTEQALGNTGSSLTLIQQAIHCQPANYLSFLNLGNTLHLLNRNKEAVKAFRDALQLKPGCPAILANMAPALADIGQLDEALQTAIEADSLDPNNVISQVNLASVSLTRGEPLESLRYSARAVELNPSIAKYHSNHLFSLHYDPQTTPEQLWREHHTWHERHACHLLPKNLTHSNSPQPDRPLRIGYVSPDFKKHSVGFFILPILRHHDHGNFEVFCYYNDPTFDEMTAECRLYADHWCNTGGMSDDQFAERIRQDRVDILIDLAGHSSGNRLLVFARKPAPVQVTYLGYPDTTGLETIDYRLTDAWADPPGLTERLHSEQLLRLDGGFHCYWPYPQAPLPNELPALEAGHITFGCFNNFAKVNQPLLELWARILEAVPQSHLLFKGKLFQEESIRNRYLATFSSLNIDSSRLEFLPRLPDNERMTPYHRVDISLDTFPYHGTTTTCDSLWMGVPVLTLAGQTHVSRVGVSLLSQVELDGWIASTPAGYVGKAASFATDLISLGRLRADLRRRCARFTDGASFTGRLEAALRQSWVRWCESSRSN